ncbi:MAG: hypothetical protein ACU0CA_06300 [Paracoccaceae bacterium]
MIDRLPKFGLAGAFTALGAAACCVLPMVMIMFGLGGSWLVVFSKVAAISPYVIAAAILLLLGGWVMAIRNGASTSTFTILTLGTSLSGLAWLVFLNEGSINDFLMTKM